MPSKLAIVCRVATLLAWGVAAFDILPWGWHLPADAALFVVAAACVGSYAWISRAHARPLIETYLAGKEVGRLEAMREQECEKVTRLSDRRLRVVDQA